MSLKQRWPEFDSTALCKHFSTQKTKTRPKQERYKGGRYYREGRRGFCLWAKTALPTRTQGRAHGRVPWSGKCKCRPGFHDLTQRQASQCWWFWLLLQSLTHWKSVHCSSPGHMWTPSKGTSSLPLLLQNQCLPGTILRLCSPSEHLFCHKLRSVLQH